MAPSSPWWSPPVLENLLPFLPILAFASLLAAGHHVYGRA